MWMSALTAATAAAAAAQAAAYSLDLFNSQG
jgi:hypothetical protein